MLGASNGKELPKEALEFAKKMGVDLSGLEAEAEDMWSMLNDMSERSGYEYDQFIKEQMDGARHEDERKKSGGSEKDTTEGSGSYFRPHNGFSVESKTTAGEDGVKIREIGNNSGSTGGKKIYINLCHHEALELPKDNQGRPVSENRLSADGLEIPLAIGPVREQSKNEVAVDVVVHPSVIKRCESYDHFKEQIVKLAIDTVQIEAGIKIDPKWKDCSSSYIGGRGKKKDTPVLFPINQTDEKNSQNDEKGEKNEPLTTSSILNAVNSQEFEDSTINESSSINITLESGDSNIKNKKIVDMDDNSAGDITKNSTSNKSSKAPKKMQKGFLFNSKTSLYAEGSNEGTGGSTGGSYAKIMSRCQVIDTNTGSVSGPTPPTLPVPINDKEQEVLPAVGNNTADTDTNLSGVRTVDNIGKPVLKSVPGKQAVKEMEDLVQSVDTEWGYGTNLGGLENNIESQQFSSMLSDMAKVSVNQPNSVLSGMTKKTEQKIAVESTLPEECKVVVKKKKSKESNSMALNIKVYELKGISALTDSHVKLQISAKKVMFSTSNEHTLRVSPPFKLDPKSSSASYSKKKNILSIEVNID